MTRLALFLTLMAASGAQAAVPARPLRPVSTFSIVARDAGTGELGVAVQSHWFAVGQIVPWAEAGVGAVATQSFVDPSYGRLGLELMRTGKSAPDALRSLLGGDPSRDVRQVAMIDAKGAVAAWTGRKDVQAAGDAVGSAQAAQGFEGGRIDQGADYSVQANLMSNDRVWPAMQAAYEQAQKAGADLTERLLAALDAAQAAGGDIRGRQSAALVVVKAQSSGRAWEDRVFDLRVDDTAYPLRELRRLVALQRAYNHMNAGDLAVEHKDPEGALREYSAAEQIAEKTEGVLPSRLAEMRFWHAVALANMKRVDESLPVFQKVFAGPEGASWRELVGRLPQSELLAAELVPRIQALK